MAFMKPEYMIGRFATVEPSRGESYVIPAGDLNLRDVIARYGEDAEIEITIHERGWWVRFAAPGFLDSTDWEGPYATREAAEKHISDFYDVDPVTGEDLPDE